MFQRKVILQLSTRQFHQDESLIFADATCYQSLKIVIFHGGGYAFFVVDLFIQIVFGVVGSALHEDVEFMAAIDERSNFSPYAQTDQRGEGTMRHGRSEYHSNGQRRVAVSKRNMQEVVLLAVVDVAIVVVVVAVVVAVVAAAVVVVAVFVEVVVAVVVAVDVVVVIIVAVVEVVAVVIMKGAIL